MLAMRAILAAAAALVASAALPAPSPHPNCAYTPTGYTSDQVSYSLEFFANNGPWLIYDERDRRDPFLYQVNFCGDLPQSELVSQACVQTRGQVNESACTPLRYSDSPAYQFLKSSNPSQVTAALDLADTPGSSTPITSDVLRSARAAGVDLPAASRVVTGARKDAIVAAARRQLGARPASIRPSAPVAAAVRAAEAAQAVDVDADTAQVGASPCVSDKCWRTAATSSVPANIQYRPLYGNAVVGSTHMASGMTVHMSGGDPCWDKGAGAGTGTAGVYNRQMNIHFVCSPQFGNFLKDALVVEASMCNYEVVLHTVHACPVQCLPDAAEGGVDLCGANGVCNWDTTSNRARCYCFEGFSGAQCTLEGDLGTPKPTGHPDQIVGGLFGGLFGGLLIAAGVVYYITYVRTPGAPSAAPAASGTGGIRSMFGGSSTYAPPTGEGADIPGIDDGARAGYTGPDGDDDGNPML
ncbi:hypothetical protein FNF27_06110 [Cafeteria roenbergensis]|uniref:Uncharacterized protein n=1 Tax=Cafeteria roenbergensis TaxID=33653 RepID=A0A5A8E8T8_CAFRO|nr:hypothetical protein FNF27_06110 [Cafeteria roenbergensis]